MESTPAQEAEGQAVVKVLAVVLERLVSANSQIARSDQGQVTKFHALRAPAIGIGQYLDRIHKYASCSNECFILALIYIDRLIQRNNFLLTELNVHRVVITAVLLAAKFFDDAYYNNAYYAKVGGVLVSEMNSLEVEFLFRINFSLRVLPDAFEKYHAELIAHANAIGLKRPPHCPPDASFNGMPSDDQPHIPHQAPPQDPAYQEQPSAYAQNGSSLQFRTNVNNIPVAPQAQFYQHQLVNHFLPGVLPPQTTLQNPPHITPSPPPQSCSKYTNGAPILYNNDETSCINLTGVAYDSKAAAHQHLPIAYNRQQGVTSGPTRISSSNVAPSLQQKLLLTSATATGEILDELGNDWGHLPGIHNQNLHIGNRQASDLASNSLECGNYAGDLNVANPSSGGVSASFYFQSSTLPYNSVQSYSNVQLSGKSSPGRPLNHSHTIFSSAATNPTNQAAHHGAVVHRNYPDYGSSDVDLSWQGRQPDMATFGSQHFATNPGNNLPLRGVAHYVNNSPQVES